MIFHDQRPSIQSQGNYHQSKFLKNTHNPFHFGTKKQQDGLNKRDRKPVPKQKDSSEHKYSSRLQKQTQKIKTLQQEYMQLEQQLSDVKQMINLKLELLKHTTTDITINQQKHPNQRQTKHSALPDQINQEQLPIDRLKAHIENLAQSINTLFIHQSTIEAANTNYLLLTQVNKEQQSETLFHINNLQQKIKEQRLLLNGKEQLLVYESATIHSSESSLFLEQKQQKQILLQYNTPRKLVMVNFATMDSDFRFLQKTLKEMTHFRQSVFKIQNLIDNKVVRKEDNFGDVEKNALEKQPKKQINFTQKPQRRGRQLQFFPLQVLDYRSSLIYRVFKLTQGEKQKRYDLKKKYMQLSQEYLKENNKREQLANKYEKKRNSLMQKKKKYQQTINQNESFHSHKKDCQSGGKLQNILNELYQNEPDQSQHRQIQQLENVSDFKQNPISKAKSSQLKGASIELPQKSMLTSFTGAKTLYIGKQSKLQLLPKESLLLNKITNEVISSKKKTVKHFLQLENPFLKQKYYSQKKKHTISKNKKLPQYKCPNRENKENSKSLYGAPINSDCMKFKAAANQKENTEFHDKINIEQKRQ